MKRIYICLRIGVAFLFFVFLASCTCKPENAEKKDIMPPIYPDYVGVTIPVGMAPLNFNVIGNVDIVYVRVKGSVEGELTATGSYADFDIDEWHKLLSANKGGQLEVTVFAKGDGKWIEYKTFPVYVSNYPLEAWGLTYRRIAPGYEVYSKMGIYQRCLGSFEETPIIENTVAPGSCVNCHTSNKTDPQRFTFHVRGEHGATLVQIDDRREWIKAFNDSIHGSMVYPYWHPSGNYCAYSTNQTYQSYHAVKGERIEVFDQSSDVFVYEPSTHQLLLDTLLMTPDHFETYPVFSPDGTALYFCSAVAEPIPSRYKYIRYDLCKIDFDPNKREFGERVDTLFSASSRGMSATHPRISYDGRWLMFTMADYGCFPIWHKEADNWILDLTTGIAHPLETANSEDTDSWHNWSIDSHWFVFTSRRGDGLYTRLYLACVDEDGNASKPFLLPQENPYEYYDALLDSYNTPDFTSRKVEFDMRQACREIMSDKRIPTKVK